MDNNFYQISGNFWRLAFNGTVKDVFLGPKGKPNQAYPMTEDLTKEELEYITSKTKK